MSTKYHVNPDTGRPNICRAKTPEACKYYNKETQTESPHFATKDEAREHIEKEMKKEYSNEPLTKADGEKQPPSKPPKTTQELKDPEENESRFGQDSLNTHNHFRDAEGNEWRAREHQPGFWWTEGVDETGTHIRQGLVPASTAKEAADDLAETETYEFGPKKPEVVEVTSITEVIGRDYLDDFLEVDPNNTLGLDENQQATLYDYAQRRYEMAVEPILEEYGLTMNTEGVVTSLRNGTSKHWVQNKEEIQQRIREIDIDYVRDVASVFFKKDW